MVLLIVWMIQMKRIVMKKNANEIDESSVRKKANVHEGRMHNGRRRKLRSIGAIVFHLDVMELRIVKTIQTKRIVPIVMEIED